MSFVDHQSSKPLKMLKKKKKKSEEPLKSMFSPTADVHDVNID